MKKMVIVLAVCILVSMNASAQQVFPDIIKVCEAPNMQGWPQACYNPDEDEYLVVWEDYRFSEVNHAGDIFGQIVRADGTLRGSNFVVCGAPGDQYWPHCDYDTHNKRYLVVFEDYRNGGQEYDWMGNWDIYGVLLDIDGKKVPTLASEGDTCFAITRDPAAVHYPSVAYNWLFQAYLVVWADYRNSTTDIYGQRVSGHGVLLAKSADPLLGGNFPISNHEEVIEDVPDVSYSMRNNEWLVSFAYLMLQAPNCAVLCQRVNRYGQLLKQDGTYGWQGILVTPVTGMCNDGTQSRVQYNNECFPKYAKAAGSWGFCEALVAWTAYVSDQTSRDVHGQRIGFFPEAQAVALGLKPAFVADSLFFASLLDENGNPGAPALPNYPISNALSCQFNPEIAYSQEDNEFGVDWGDNRNIGSSNEDVFCQRLHVDGDTDMVWLNEGRTGAVATDVNIVLESTPMYEGAWNTVGAAHSHVRNEFLFVYDFNNDMAGGSPDIHAKRMSGSAPTGVGTIAAAIPASFEVLQNYPNPFNPETAIMFGLPESGAVKVAVFDLQGREVRVLLDGERPAGHHSVTWDGTDTAGRSAATGIYTCRVVFGGQTVVKKMTLLR